jgi:nucleotide-binding universal stress UspA family protein
MNLLLPPQHHSMFTLCGFAGCLTRASARSSGKRDVMYKKIVVAMDESKEAKRALASAIDLAGLLKSELTILTVSEPLPSYAGFMDAEIPGARLKLLEERNAFYCNLQKEGIAQAAAAGIEARAVIVEGNEVQSIVDHIAEHRADLLVIGRRHHSTMARFWGSTVHNIAEKSCCSILAVY